MKLHLVEITVPWEDIEINPEKFQRDEDEIYIWKPFVSNDVVNDTLKAAREKKINKYKEIGREAENGLKGIRKK
jgi:ribosomal protein L21